MDNQYSLESRNSHDDSAVGFDLVLASLQPLQDLAKNWDIDVSSWYVSLLLTCYCAVMTKRKTLSDKPFYFGRGNIFYSR